MGIGFPYPYPYTFLILFLLWTTKNFPTLAQAALNREHHCTEEIWFNEGLGQTAVLKHAAEAGRQAYLPLPTHHQNISSLFFLSSYACSSPSPSLSPSHAYSLRHPIWHFIQFISSALRHPRILLPCCKSYVTWAIIALKLQDIARRELPSPWWAWMSQKRSGDNLCWSCCLLSDQLSVVFESEMCVEIKTRRDVQQRIPEHC